MSETESDPVVSLPRGVHLTSQVSKVVERLIKQMMDPYLEKTGAYGENQFAYRMKRGSRDVLALLILEWMMALNAREKIGIYCSDVSVLKIIHIVEGHGL